MRLALFGGTFNPIHLAHVAVAEEAFRQLRLDRLMLVPAAIPPHKHTPGLVSAQHRVKMVQLAAQARVGWEVSDVEVARGGRSYSIDTVRDVIERCPLQGKPYFLIGADMLQELAAWKDVKCLVGLCQFVVVARPRISLEPPADLVEAVGLDGVKAICQTPLSAPMLDISSTDIRERIAQGMPFEHLVTPAVAAYIKEQGLYR